MGSATPLNDFVSSLAPPAYDKTTASSRRQAIEKKVLADTQCVRLVESGSWSHGTALKEVSDVDYMAIFPRPARPYYPSSALTSLKTAISGAHYAIYKLRQSSPTIQVEFFTAPDFEIVPAYFKQQVGEEHVLYIPGPGNEWIESAPVAHLAYVSNQHNRLGYRVKPLVRLLKAWKYHVGLPVSSFYLEMRTAKHASGEQSILYPIDLRWVISELESQGFRSMNDPCGLVPRIPATSSEDNRRAAVRMAKDALQSLGTAAEAEESRDPLAYWSAMSDLFGSSFPFPAW